MKAALLSPKYFVVRGKIDQAVIAFAGLAAIGTRRHSKDAPCFSYQSWSC